MPNTSICIRISIVGAGSLGVFQMLLMHTGQQNAVVKHSIKLKKPLDSIQYLSNQKLWLNSWTAYGYEVDLGSCFLESKHLALHIM